ncbi:formate dehydrogenase F4B subunit [Kushneria sinocarnis]|uniref:Formate dehydrogenase F4B subunit n=1 Tax=Kushneria sinocarnis TaxID=595502 RepID=A0A420WU20_9GAMM|nr:hypothetical protein [Kushneria sinocarnis]RKQ96939.1 formate dehydrogenase F4B subunit [Kushneria sinocarnis]
MADEAAFEALVGRILAARPALQPLEAVLLAAVIEAQQDAGDGRRTGVDTGRLARRFEIEHALVRRSAAALSAAGWLTTAPRGGRSPALRLESALPDLLQTLEAG